MHIGAVKNTDVGNEADGKYSKITDNTLNTLLIFSYFWFVTANFMQSIIAFNGKSALSWKIFIK